MPSGLIRNLPGAPPEPTEGLIRDLRGQSGDVIRDLRPNANDDANYGRVDTSGNKPRAKAQKWVIESEEAGISVVGQFTVDDLQLNTVGGVYADITSVNQSHPITQWIRGQLETVTLNSEFFAEHKNDEVTTRFGDLLKLARRDDTWGRPPICMFSFGTKLSMMCFLEHVANIGFGPLRPDGTPQRIKFTLTLRNYTPNLQQPTDPSIPGHQSLWRVAKTGDTYESIARREYGDAMVGEFLRRWHSYRPNLVEGDKVHILTKSYVAQLGRVLPQSPILYHTTTNPKVAAIIFAARSSSLKLV